MKEEKRTIGEIFINYLRDLVDDINYQLENHDECSIYEMIVTAENVLSDVENGYIKNNVILLRDDSVQINVIFEVDNIGYIQAYHSNTTTTVTEDLSDDVIKKLHGAIRKYLKERIF